LIWWAYKIGSGDRKKSIIKRIPIAVRRTKRTGADIAVGIDLYHLPVASTHVLRAQGFAELPREFVILQPKFQKKFLV
jgi:hypothetical protein